MAAHILKNFTNLRCCFFLLAAVLATHDIRGQYVTVIDSGFVNFLKFNYKGCISGNQLDTTCPDIVNAQQLFITTSHHNIADVSYVKYFKSIRRFELYSNNANGIPVNFPPLPNHLTHLNCVGAITPPAFLPDSLQVLGLSMGLSDLPPLPQNITRMGVSYNKLKTLPELPPGLLFLDCANNFLELLPSLPETIVEIMAWENLLDSLPELPDSLRKLHCDKNRLTNLPPLPSKLGALTCDDNMLTELPDFPATLYALDCKNNRLKRLPTLPEGFWGLRCQSNQLTELPELPKSLHFILCSDNKISCFPVFPFMSDGYVDSTAIQIWKNPFKCLPNYTKGMSDALLKYPLCSEDDPINNPRDCPEALGVSGRLYLDEDDNCEYSLNEKALPNLPLTLRDSNKLFLSRYYSFTGGFYNILSYKGKYTLGIDTSGLPVRVKCDYPGNDSSFSLEPSSSVKRIDFGLECKPGFDVGIQSVTPRGRIFPGQQFHLQIIAGDLSRQFGLKCADGVSGALYISVSGKVKYTGGGTTPSSVKGNDFTYDIADFGKIDNRKDFILTFFTDTNAIVSDSVCVFISVSPSNGDKDISNNTRKICFRVGNSYDPNMKEVYPLEVPDKFQDWLTYTIHFQNTGSAPAYNIRLADTLDRNLDPESFQTLGYSHPVRTSLNGRSISFKFKDIMLPDSFSDESGSHGYVQYRIKPKPDLPLGTKIKNTAYIYFDYNNPVVTNTTTNEYVKGNVSLDIQRMRSLIKTYPNPSTGRVSIATEKKFSLTVTDLAGKIILQTSNAGEITLQKGVFFFLYLADGMQIVEKVVVY